MLICPPLLLMLICPPLLPMLLCPPLPPRLLLPNVDGPALLPRDMSFKIGFVVSLDMTVPQSLFPARSPRESDFIHEVDK